MYIAKSQQFVRVCKYVAHTFVAHAMTRLCSNMVYTTVCIALILCACAMYVHVVMTFDHKVSMFIT